MDQLLGRRGARGASTVELAVSMLILIPVVIYALYSGEIFIIAFKAQEAEYSATFDATAPRIHDFESGSAAVAQSRLALSGVRAAERTTRALSDFDSFTDSDRQARELVLGTGRRGTVSCAEQRLPEDETFHTFDQAWARDDRRGRLQGFLYRGGFLACRARATLVNKGPSHFLERPGGAPLLSAVAANLTLCGFGGNPSGCDGPGLSVLVDDWGLEDPRPFAPALESLGAPGQNQKFYRVGEAVYAMNGPGISTEQAEEMNDFLRGQAERHDPGHGSTFKLGYLTPISQPRNLWMQSYRGPARAHLTPFVARGAESWGDPQLQYTARRNGNYLGHPQATFNQP